MRYRIKITVKQGGNKEYLPQVRNIFTWGGWEDLLYCPVTIRDFALKRIDEHNDSRIKSIEFEYINKK